MSDTTQETTMPDSAPTVMNPQAPPGSLHKLRSHLTVEVFQWTGKSWSTPSTGYGTRPSAMAALGWVYLEPSNDR